MSYKPILIVAGEPNSVFFEIFFKSITKNYFKSPFDYNWIKKFVNKTNELIEF